MKDKKQYVAPQLEVLGTVQGLTAGSYPTGSMFDGTYVGPVNQYPNYPLIYS